MKRPIDQRARATRVFVLALLAAACSPAASGSAGPGLANRSWTAAELLTPLATLRSPGGHGAVAMVGGHLLVVYSSDGGGTPDDGGIELWDVSDALAPRLVLRRDDDVTHGLREAHALTFGIVGGRTYAALQAIDGVQVWDVGTPGRLRFVSALALPGVAGGDYEGAWWVAWQGRHLFVAGQGSGLFVVDVSDPEHPFLARHVETGELGGLRPGTVFPVGNLLLVAESRGGRMLSLDVGDPLRPVPLEAFEGKRGYSHLFAAGRMLTAGGGGGQAHRLYVTDVGHDGSFTPAGKVGAGLGEGGYGSWQDGAYHGGFSLQYAKMQVATLEQLGTATSNADARDEDFAQVLGNLVFVGDDHGQGSALVAHASEPDDAGPRVDWCHPPDGATDQPLASRVGLAFSDAVDPASLGPGTCTVRPVGGAPLVGDYGVLAGLAGFAPRDPLEPGTTYEVVVEGVRDYAGNPGPRSTSSFTTADEPAGSAPACFLHTSGPAPVGATVSFRADLVAVPEGARFVWDFGDGSTPLETEVPEATHVYAAPGRHDAGLAVVGGPPTGCRTVQIVHRPLVPGSDGSNASGSIRHAGGKVFVVNPDNDTASALRKGTLQRAWEVPAGDDPRSVAIAPDGAVWVVARESASVHVLDPRDGAELVRADLPRGSRPFGVVCSPVDGTAYVSLQGTGRVVALDATGALLREAQVGPSPRALALSPDGARLFVTRFVSGAEGGEVRELDAATLVTVRTYELPFDPGPDTEASGRGVPNYLAALALSPDGDGVLVAAKKDDVARGAWRDGLPLTFENTVRALVARLDRATGEEDVSARLDLDDRSLPQALAFSPLGDVFFVATLASNRVEAFDAVEGKLLASAPTGRGPLGMTLDADAARLYVHEWLERRVAVFDARPLLEGRRNRLEPLATVPLAASEALPPTVLAGKRIFHDASDPRTSRDGYLACASCHFDGEGDGRTWDFTQAGEGLRNTIALRGGAGAGLLHWTANFDEVQDFEHDLRGFAGGSGLLSDADFAATADPLGAPKAGLSAELDALAAYVASLEEPGPSPHRAPDGSLSAEGALGRDVFHAAGCADCHPPPRYADGLRHDVGSALPSSGLGHGEPLAGFGFDTPSLVGVWSSAPYLHDGRAATLEDALALPGHGGALAPAERVLVVRYLLQIDGTDETR